jgi:hypothetical protein
MLVTPNKSTRTARYAVANRMKVRKRENAGCNNRIAFDHKTHSDSGCSRFGMVQSMVMLGRVTQ